MKVWIYDENSYPSGFAGGHVPAAMPDAVRAGLRMVKAGALSRPRSRSEPVVVLRKAETGFEDITAAAQGGHAAAGTGEYLRLRPQPPEAEPLVRRIHLCRPHAAARSPRNSST